jgi:uncharacterized membrane protein
MPWLFGVLGAIFGLANWGFEAMVALGVLGFLAGLALRRASAQDKAMDASATAPSLGDPIVTNATASATPVEYRVARLEARVAQLEAALRAGGATIADEPADAAALTPFATAAPQAAPAAIPTVPGFTPFPAPAYAAAQAETTEAFAMSSPAPRAPEPPEPPPPPAEPTFLHNLIFGGNTIVRIGIVVLFFGLVFLAKYAADAGMFPVEVRMTAIAIAAIALLVIGWRLRESKPAYALNMQGGGIAVLYLTVFASYRLFGLIPPLAAFVLMIAVAAFAAFLAVMQNALPLALIGTIGGFVAPILVSTGHGNHVMLFAYMLILNLGVLAIAWKKSWRSLEGVAFAFTWGIAALWGLDRYKPELYGSTQPFLIAFFLLFLVMALLVIGRTNRQLDAHKDATDEDARPVADTDLAINGALTFGTPVIAFVMQSWLVRHIEFGTAFSAVAFGAVYLALGAWLRGRNRGSENILFQIFLAIGVAFTTLAIPFAFDARVTAGSWALEGAALFWLGLKQRKPLAQYAGLGLQLAAGAAFIYALGTSEKLVGAWPLANTQCLGALLLAGAGFASARWAIHHTHAGDAEDADAHRLQTEMPWLPTALSLWALGWTWIAGGFEIDRFVASQFHIHAALAWTTAVALLAHTIGRRWDLSVVHTLSLLLIIPAIIVGVGDPSKQLHPSSRFGWLLWPFVFIAYERFLARPSARNGPSLISLTHSLRAILFIFLLTAEAVYWVNRTAEGAWPLAALIAVPALLLLAMRSRTQADRPDAFMQWTAHHSTYSGMLLPGLAGVLLVMVLMVTLGSSGAAAPLPFIPLLNPLDLASLFAWLAAMLCWVGGPQTVFGVQVGSRARWLGLLAVAFVMGNGMLLRALHHLFAVPYNWNAVFSVPKAQMAFSIAWTLAGIACMLWAHRNASRATWGVGAALLAVVVGKLFVFDLASARGLERIISFVVVGLLLLAVGYFAPVPPSAKASTSEPPTTPS